MPEVAVRDVPPENVGEGVQSFIDSDHATKVVAIRNDDGTFDLIATIPGPG